jgi:trehalose 6-phosphate synthase/phosphatase
MAYNAAMLIIASNRLPVTVVPEGNDFSLRASTGGLATGLASLIESEHARWVGWHGCAGASDSADHRKLAKALSELGMEAVSLAEDEVEGYYNDFSNGAVWPLYHYQTERMPLTLLGWEKYCSVNERFCDAIVDIYSEGDVIWIHDYHL